MQRCRAVPRLESFVACLLNGVGEITHRPQCTPEVLPRDTSETLDTLSGRFFR